MCTCMISFNPLERGGGLDNICRGTPLEKRTCDEKQCNDLPIIVKVDNFILDYRN